MKYKKVKLRDLCCWRLVRCNLALPRDAESQLPDCRPTARHPSITDSVLTSLALPRDAESQLPDCRPTARHPSITDSVLTSRPKWPVLFYFPKAPLNRN